MDRRLKIYRNILWGILAAGVIGLCIYSFLFFYHQIPDELYLTMEEEQCFDWNIPASASFTENSVYKKAEHAGMTIHVDMARPFSVLGNTGGSYVMECRLFGIIPLKSVSVDVVEKQYLTPGGNTIGVYLKTDGVLAIGTSSITAADGMEYEPVRNVIRSGDYIEAVNGKKLENKDEFVEAVANSAGEKLILDIRRNGEHIRVKAEPVLGADGTYKLGIWVRDNAQGIGTLTYIDEDGNFGALGHSINDVDISTQMEIEGGSIYAAKVLSIVKGEKGDPGEILGMISYERARLRGEIKANTKAGVYGTAGEQLLEECQAQPMEIGRKQEIQIGPAVVRCSMDGVMKNYEVMIEEIHLSRDDVNKGILLRVTDAELLEKAGGIVQGMSGSPILQDGKIVGAVTHVLVNDPTRGYGIFIENMLEH